MANQPHWDKVIALVDMNCFFAQVEQQDNLFWRCRPVAVTNGKLGSTIITSSYEARAYGVKTGMRLKEARELCPDLIQAPSRPYRYAEVSTSLMAALHNITPDVEVYSVDEAFLDLTRCQTLWGSPEDMGRLIKSTINDVSGLTCSIGVSGDKTTAKYAAKLHKPDGLTIVAPEDAEQLLSSQPVTALSGINKGTAKFLAQYGVYKCGDMKKIPISIVAKRFGNLGRRIWLMAQGKDPEPMNITVPAPKTIGHGKVLPPGTAEKDVVLTYFQHMSEKVAARLRRHGFKASQFFVGFKTQDGWSAIKVKSGKYTDDGQFIFQQCQQFLTTVWDKHGVWQVQVTALDPQTITQLDLFIEETRDNKRHQLNQAIDCINNRYGEFTISPTRLMGKSEMPNVIAPAWKPTGHRKTV